MARDLEHLNPAEAVLASAAADARRVAAASIVGLVLVGWIILLTMAAASGVAGGGFAPMGPGMAVFDRLADWVGLERIAFPLAASSGLFSLLAMICAIDPAMWSVGQAGVHLTMWMAMALAMMLPTAAPMLRTYSEIADTAAARGIPVVSPLVLVTGYLAIWFTFAVAATGLHWLLGIAGVVTGSAIPAAAGVSAAILAIAGIYQFLPVKAACLVKCANPFPYLFANWSERSWGVFRLGVGQGLYCLACCWAMMLVMFAVGVMNIIWVAGLGAVMTAEKLVGRTWFSRTIGSAFLLLAAAVALGAAAG